MIRASRTSSTATGIDGAPGDPASDLPASRRTRILRASARVVRDRWQLNGAAERDEVEEELGHLLDWVQAYGGSVPDDDGNSYPGGNRFLTRRLIEALRLTTLHRWQEEGGDDPEEAVAYLGVLSTLERLARTTLPKDARELTSRLADPDGFELLVEAAHDLRSPLTSIGFLAETLREGHSGEINEVQRTQLGLIYSAALGMTSVVTDIVDLARRGLDLIEGPPETFSISEPIHDVQRLVQPIADEKGIDLVIDHQAHDRVEGHALALSRILLNLVTNALKFTEDGTVRLSTRQVAHDVVEFSVEDTGRGMTEEEQAVIFQTFRKSAARAGSFFSGSGLGLSIARRLVDALDAELELESEPGEGSRFHFELRLPPVAHL